MYQRIGAAAYIKDLYNTRQLCHYLGNPEKKLNAIHIAGTNGKGSVSHMVASVLQEAGYKTGLYTSPHLRDFRERIKIDGHWITQDYVVEFVKRVKPIIARISPSFFELTVAMAYDYFALQNVDWAVIETGMGGRLDSTNVIKPRLSIITNIGFDHMEILGNTLPQIAYEKAGIIKDGTPVVIGEQHPLTKMVFSTKAKEKKASIYFAEEMYQIENERYDSEGLHFVTREKNGDEIEIKSALSGNYQVKNIRTVAAAVSILSHNEIPNLMSYLSKGIENTIKNTGLEGRWQQLGENPTIICDTGHNEDGIMEVVSMLNRQRYERLWMIIGTVNDKDLNKILPLFPENAEYIFTQAMIPRALSADRLSDAAAQFGIKGKVIKNVTEAIDYANSQSQQEDFIFIGGSTFVVAEALTYLMPEVPSTNF